MIIIIIQRWHNKSSHCHRTVIDKVITTQSILLNLTINYERSKLHFITEVWLLEFVVMPLHLIKQWV